MPSLFDPRERARLHQRLDALTPVARARWGRMTAPRVVCHLVDAVESAFDTETDTPGTGPLSRQPLKWLVLHLLPWPRARMDSPPRLLRRLPGDWATDRAALHAAIDALAARDPHAAWPPSDVFGELSREEWGALLRTHFDHHLKQFGA